MKIPITVKYALERGTNKSVYIKDAQNGLQCNCYCEVCLKDLIAVQGKLNEWHFRHDSNTDCFGAQEKAIHKFAKQIISENSKIAIKDYFLYSDARLEEQFQSIRPDVTININGEPVHIEITVTNKINDLKYDFYKNGKHRSFEIDLSKVPDDITSEELKELVLGKGEHKKIIFWAVEQKTPVLSIFKDLAPVFIFVTPIVGFIYYFFNKPKSKQFLKKVKKRRP